MIAESDTTRHADADGGSANRMTRNGLAFAGTKPLGGHSEFMFIKHESDHDMTNQKLVVSSAINQVLHSLLARLLRIGNTALRLFLASPPPLCP